MIDSCNPSKLDPGLHAAYSIPKDRIRSTMKSEQGCSTTRPEDTGCAAPFSRASVAPSGAGALAFPRPRPPLAPCCGACAEASSTPATNPAAPLAAPLMKPRRPTEVSLDFCSSCSFGLTRDMELPRPPVLSARPAPEQDLAAAAGLDCSPGRCTPGVRHPA